MRRVLLHLLGLTLVLEVAEVCERAVELPAEAGFVPAEEGQSPALGQFGESEGDPAYLVDGAAIFCEGLFLVVHFDVDHSGLDGHDAAETPAAGNHFEDEVEFDFIGGLEPFGVRVEQFVKHVAGFVREHERIRG